MPNLVSRENWLSQRLKLLEKEKNFTRDRDALSHARRDLPMVEITTPYRFATVEGEKSLPDLFADKEQLLVYHFMYGPEWESGCPSCSFFVDNFEGIETHLAARNTALVLASNAPLATLEAYRARMGWTIPWVSALNTSFGEDFGVSFPTQADMDGNSYNYGKKPYAGESPGLSVFYKLNDGRVAHSYSTYGRGLDILNGAYNLLDLTPNGRDEADLPYAQAWVRRHDEYA
ncbi:DUF899 domain-containing protein [Roseobacter sp. YSTF-M11]|uniref:DUF899 domain-containing protein n=1 Tax=Roseobacter insulae TaxID=2859783 RepID=A0A9X1JXK7_9RHOB|nr:DUF899 domain-containing protein [Roseobacter insulae]MBW4707355.1 DUF899 domain-containing protein [Roseobacter insulae]